MKKIHGFGCAAALLIAIAPLATSCGTVHHDIELTVWAATNVKAQFQEQANRWAAEMAKEENGGFDVGVTVSAVGEGEAASNMITDVQAGADLFCFAQDQLARLRSAGALTEIVDANLKAKIIADNDEVSVSAASVGDSLVAYPLTSDNGFFMYYDKSVFTDESKLENLEDIISVCEAAGKKIYFNCAGSAWYNAAFFFGFGCESTWKTNSQGLFYEYTDTYNSDDGIKACTALYNLVNTHKSVFVDNSGAADAWKQDDSGKISGAVCVSGTWDYTASVTALGTNLGATDLPSVTVGEDTVHLASFAGCKLMGVKPQTDAKRGALSQLLAQELTGAACQLERFNAFGWGPSNLADQETEAVKSSIALSALRKQNEYSVIQGQYPGDWWTSCAAIGQALAADSCGGTRAEIKAILNKYESTIDSYINGEPDVA